MKEKQRVWEFFAHAGIIIGMMFVVFFVIDLFNPAMEFLTSSLSKWLMLLLAILAIGDGLFSAVLLFQRQKRHEENRRSNSAATVNHRQGVLPPQRQGQPTYPARYPEPPARGLDQAAYLRREPSARR